jgi:hypothetical protein
MPQLGERNSRLSNDANHHVIPDPSINQKETYADLARQPRVPHRDAQVATMDHQRLEALSRSLGMSVTRKRFFALSLGVPATSVNSTESAVCAYQGDALVPIR